MFYDGSLHVSLCATSGGRESLADSFEVFNVATVQDPGFISTQQYIVTQTAL